MYRKFLRIAALLVTLVMCFQLSGCTSIFMSIVPETDSDEEGDRSQQWDTASYSSEVITSYPTGKDAFYVDESKCIKSEIEEFHLLALCNDQTLYYFTSPTNPDYNGSDKNTGYYCLATYNYETKEYSALEEGFYPKESGSVSMASDFDTTGNGMACIGDTFLHIYDMSVQAKFKLSDDIKNDIKDDVGGEYLCYDITISDMDFYVITAAYMSVPKSDSEAEDEDEFKSVLYSVTFDTAEEPVHTFDKRASGLDGSVGNLCSAFSRDSNMSGWTYTHVQSDDQDNVEFRSYYFDGERHIRLPDAYLKGKDDSESLKGFTACVDSSNRCYILLLYEDRLELWETHCVTVFTLPTNMGFNNETSIRLDDSFSYISLDETPSIVVHSADTIYTCSLKKGFRQFVVGDNGLPTVTTFADGAYYAAYSSDGGSCTLIGFNTTSHAQTTNTYKNGQLSSSKSKNVEYSMNDMPYAKVYYAYVGAGQFPINTGVTVSTGTDSGQESST